MQGSDFTEIALKNVLWKDCEMYVFFKIFIVISWYNTVIKIIIFDLEIGRKDLCEQHTSFIAINLKTPNPFKGIKIYARETNASNAHISLLNIVKLGFVF